MWEKSRVGVQDSNVLSIREAGKNFELRPGGVPQQSQGLIAVTREDNMIEGFFALTRDLNSNRIGKSPDTRDGSVEPDGDGVTPAINERVDITSRPSLHSPPLRASMKTQKSVMMVELGNEPDGE